MAQNHVQPGEIMPWTNGTGADVASGDPVLVESMLCVALGDIADGESGSLATQEVWSLPKAAVDINQGEDIFWDIDGDPVGGEAGSGCLTNVVADVLAGKAFAPAVAADATVKAKINA